MAERASKIKTTISLPRDYCHPWADFRGQIPGRLNRYLAIHLNSPCRDRARRYQPVTRDYVKINVYWDLALYNRLHAVAAALRLSVSALLVALLSMDYADATPDFSRYAFKVIKWGNHQYLIGEGISVGPPRHRKHSRFRK